MVQIPHRCSVFDWCDLTTDNDKVMKIYFCSFCRKVIGYLREDDDEFILKLAGEAVTGFKQNELSKEEIEKGI